MRTLATFDLLAAGSTHVTSHTLTRTQTRTRSVKIHRRTILRVLTLPCSPSVADLAWRDAIVFSPGHQNPAKAPAVPIPNIENTTLTFNNSVSAFDPRDLNLHSFQRRDALRCDDGPCVDKSCCSKEGICGYGPSFCGDGNCTSLCNATAMCGEFSENADMPCVMNLCCSAMGWCGSEPLCRVRLGTAHVLLTHRHLVPKEIEAPPDALWDITSRGTFARGNATKFPLRSLTVSATLTCSTLSHSSTRTPLKIVPAHSDDDAMMREFVGLSKDGKLQTWIAIGGFDFSNPEAATHTTCTYGFQGVDLDWEYPGAPERGGRKLADTRNFTLLLREMRAVYGTRYGISLTLAPDYWYLRWFDAKAMESSVDFFGFMAYDLHGSWDSDVLALGKKVRGQTDIHEIGNNTIPLWFDGLDPKKINFGLAMYGRGYTLSDPSCNELLCPFSGPSKPAPCTDFGGVMSLHKIQQWIGYDDDETFAAKKEFADGMCFGGTMIWSIDFQVGGSGSDEPDGGGEVVYLAPGVYTGGPAQCTAPCRFVLPPRALPSPTTISIPLYITSIELAPGTTTTITVTVPAITTSSIEYYNVPITSGQPTTGYTFTPTASLSIQPVTTTFTLSGGATQVRTLVLPPWPAITIGPSGDWNSTDSNSTNPGNGTGTGWPFHNIPPLGPPPPSVTIPSREKPEWTPPVVPDPPAATIWPALFEIRPVETEVPEGGEDDDGDGPKSKSTCKLWFFGICIKWADFDVNIGGWEWNMPVGTWGPGPPPVGSIKLPPGFTIKGALPPWPKITVLPGDKVNAPIKPADCTPAEASLCLTTSSFGTTVSGGATRTTATEVKSTCATITGCNFRDAETTTTVDAC
ncbi:putative glycoside hydrolase family 18 protein [Venustampulla echinocandica]|uniref:chitinase n=1 Tax=Venustampulla echinocandica TaxID=2656787 RepID=A0A370U0D3_9HELO|nr:putative glycoside hydrolase family 18 protein [Venustampulla echinocandica]RDL41225.1 putative glycoside hydrolase family 18 protein [Venustampulla echinocandica]